MAKTGKLLRSLIRAGARTAKLFAAAATPPKPKRRRAKAVTPIKPITPLTPFASLLPPLPAAKARASRVATPPKPRAPAKPRAARPAASTTPRPAAVAPGKWLTAHVLTAAGQRMSYWLYLPNSLPERAQSQGMPLVVMLHGCHQTATQFAQGTRMNLWAEKKGYAVLYPQQLTTIQPQRCWKWYDRATQEGGGDVPTIIAMIHKVLTQYAIDRSRIYVAGISAGAGMANILALNHPGLFAAVGLHSGPVFGAGHNTLGALGVMKHGAPGWRADVAVHEVLQRQPQFLGMPAIVLQGASDNVVRPINQLQLARQSMLLNRLSGEAKATHKPKGRHNAHQLHDFHVGRKLMLRIAHIEQLDHAWSGGDPAFAFNAKAGPDASKMLLDFFARHHR